MSWEHKPARYQVQRWATGYPDFDVERWRLEQTYISLPAAKRKAARLREHGAKIRVYDTLGQQVMDE